MNIFTQITFITLVSIPLISLASDNKLWERNMQERQAEQAKPMLVEGAASKMEHTSVEHKRFILGENFPDENKTIQPHKDNAHVIVHTDHMGVDHKRQMLGEN